MIAFSALRAACAATLGATALLTAAPAVAQSAPRSLDVPYVPTPQVVVDRMLEIAQVTSTDYVIDLGSGDGRIPVTAAARYGAKAMGVDLNPQRIAEANENARDAKVTDRVTFANQDLFATEIGEASVLTMYLLPSVNMRLRPRLFDELAPGTRVVSHAFDMEDWEPDQRELVDGRSVYLWIIPARVAGTWRVSGTTPMTLELEQHHQMLSGTARRAGQALPITDGRVRGNTVTFTVDGTTYSGTLTQGAIAGDGGNWHALRG